MEPTRKSYSLRKAINAFAGVDTEECIYNNACVFCGTIINPITDFKDELSKKEFSISGLCQECQDKTFK